MTCVDFGGPVFAAVLGLIAGFAVIGAITFVRDVFGRAR